MKKYYIFILISLLIIFTQCSLDNINAPEDFSVSHARHFFESNASDLRIPNTDPEYNTKSTSINIDEIIVPIWNKSKYSENSIVYRYEIPLRQSRSIGAHIIKDDDNTITSAHVVSTLVIEKSKNNGRERLFIATTIGIFPDNRKYDHHSYLYTGDRSDFTGFLIISDETGKILSSFQYKNGARRSVHLGKKEYNCECDCGGNCNHDCDHNHSNCCGSSNTAFAYRLFTLDPLTKGGDGDGGGDLLRYCYYCHKNQYFVDACCTVCGLWNELDEVVVIACSICGSLDWCNCQSGGDNPPDPNTNCPHCQESYCSGECIGGGNNAGGNNGGNGNQGGQNGGNGNGLQGAYKLIRVSSTLENISAQIGTQLPNMCAPEAMSFISAILGDTKNVGQIILTYYQISNEPFNFNFEGMSPDYYSLVLSNYFMGHTTNNPYTYLNSNYPVFAWYISGVDEGHAVVIVGYNVLYELIYWDPSTGSFKVQEGEVFEEYYYIESLK